MFDYGPALTLTNCWTLTCSDCDTVLRDPHQPDQIGLFSTQAAALDNALDGDWHRFATLDTTCPRCTSERTCEDEHHSWTPWAGCTCGCDPRAIPLHPAEENVPPALHHWPTIQRTCVICGLITYDT